MKNALLLITFSLNLFAAAFDPDNPRVQATAVVPRVTSHIELTATNNEAGTIELFSPTNIYKLTLTVDTNGTLILAYGSTNMLKIQIGTAANYSGTGTNVLGDDGAFHPKLTDAQVTNFTTLASEPNINATDGKYPVRETATNFTDGAWYAPGTSTNDAAINGSIYFGGTSNRLSRSGANLSYTNGSLTGVNFTITDGTGGSTSLQTDSSGGTAQSFFLNSSRAATLFDGSFVMKNGGAIGFSTGDPYTTAFTTRLQHEGSGIMALNNATTAQIFRIYNSTNSGTGDYERFSISPLAASDGVVYNTEAGGGGTYRSHTFRIGGTNFVSIGRDGILMTPRNTNSYFYITGPASAGYFFAQANGSLELGHNGIARTRLNPTAADGGPFNILGSGRTISFGIHTAFQNNGTNVGLVDFDGTGEWNRIVLAATTNQVTFGSTNVAPSSSIAPTKWVSVKVAGESVAYRIPLYE